jgi:D-arabinose 1-dehydrogenase-like Zn-dependent alcohol dehydrogenase
MRGAVLHAPGDVRVEERARPVIEQPTDAVIRLSAACVCGSDLWPYRGVETYDGPAAMGHEYAGVVEEVGGLRPGAAARAGRRGIPGDGRAPRHQGPDPPLTPAPRAPRAPPDN